MKKSSKKIEPYIPSSNKTLSPVQQEELLSTLEERFEQNTKRHEGLEWANIVAKLAANPHKLWSLYEMERTGGEPDVVGYDEETAEYIFCDCSQQSPAGRRSICYDAEALEEREKKGVYPRGSAVAMADVMGIALLTEEKYRQLQEVEEFDTTTSSWIKTPPDVRERGGAIFADRRYGRTFVYHNGAPSFYAARGFRGLLKV